MNQRKYDILMYTPIGERKGTMEVQIEHNRTSGQMNILKHTEPFEGSIDENGYCCITGRLVTLMRTVPYIATGHILADSLNLSLKGERDVFNITGFICQEELCKCKDRMK